MKIVLDTNVLIAAFISHGACHELLEHCAIRHEIILSPFIYGEFKEKLNSKFGFTKKDADAAIRLLKTRCISVRPNNLAEPVCKDKDDDNIIATAISGECDCIITGDKDLLILEIAENIRILSPGDFWEYEAGFSE